MQNAAPYHSAPIHSPAPVPHAVPYAALTVDHLGCEHLSRDIALIERVASEGSKGPTEVVYLYTAPQQHVAGDNQPRYTTKRLHDEIAKAKAAERMEVLDELDTKAVGQMEYFARKQQDLPCLDDYLDEEGMLHLPDDIVPLLQQNSTNGRLSEAEWWKGTIREMKKAEPPSPQQQLSVSQALLDIAAERRRQVEAEGWTTEHDDEHTDGSMALAAGSYCESAARPTILARKPGAAFAIPKLWPQSWSRDWWKPKSPREDLVRAAALIIAEIDRLDRATATETRADV